VQDWYSLGEGTLCGEGNFPLTFILNLIRGDEVHKGARTISKGNKPTALKKTKESRGVLMLNSGGIMKQIPRTSERVDRSPREGAYFFGSDAPVKIGPSEGGGRSYPREWRSHRAKLNRGCMEFDEKEKSPFEARI